MFVSHATVLDFYPLHTCIDLAFGLSPFSANTFSFFSTSVLGGYPGNWKQGISCGE